MKMRKLSGKTINSLALCVALAAPLVYLFGSLFMSLAGAHGEQMYAQGEMTEQWIETNAYELGKNYRLTINDELNQSVIDKTTNQSFNFLFSLNSYQCQKLIYQVTSTNKRLLLETTQNTYPGLLTYTISTQTLVTDTAMPWIMTFTCDAQAKSFLDFANGRYTKLEVLQLAPSETSLENKASYSEYIFGQFFTYDNFLAESGREVLNGTPMYGFEPIGELVRYTDQNMLHLANLSYGPLVVGYTYYCAHVLIVDLIFYIGSFIPRLIKKCINKLEGGLD